VPARSFGLHLFSQRSQALNLGVLHFDLRDASVLVTRRPIPRSRKTRSTSSKEARRPSPRCRTPSQRTKSSDRAFATLTKSVALLALADDLAIEHVERGERLGRAIALIFERHGGRPAPTLAPSEHDSDDHQHDADRTGHRESLDDRAERTEVIDDDRGDDLPGDDETDRIADAEARREKRDG